jgi:hypothetical protein
MLDLAAHGLRLRPLVAAAPEPRRGLAKLSVQPDHLPIGVDRVEPGARRVGLALLQRIEVVLVVAGELGQDRALGGARLLQLVDHQVGEAGADRMAHVGVLGKELVEDEEEVAAVEAAGLGEDAVMGGAELGELGIGRLGPRLQRVDPLQQARQQPGRVAADLLGPQRQLVDAVEQHRQPLGGAEHVEEGVEAGGLGVLAQEPLRDRLPGADPELLVGAFEQRLHSLAQPPGGGECGGEDENALGPGPLRREPREAAGQPLRLAGPGRPQQEQRPLGVGDCPLLPARLGIRRV